MSIDNQIFEYFREEKNKIKEAKKILKEYGFYVDNLLSIYDVQDHYECTDIEAMGVLDTVMSSKWLVENTSEMIKHQAIANKLKAKSQKIN